MNWHLSEEFETPGGVVRWASFGSGTPIVLVHGTPFSSFLWRDIAPALAQSHEVFVWDLLGFGQSDKCDDQDVGLTAQGRLFTQLLRHWGLSSPRVVAHDIGGAVALRALLLEGASYADLTLVDAVGGGEWGTGYFRLIRENASIFEQLPEYAHEALVRSHVQNATHCGYAPETLEAYIAPWRGAAGQAAFYRQYRQIEQAQTEEFEDLLGRVSIPTRIIWGREDRLLPAEFARLLHARIPGSELIWVEEAGHTVQEDAPAELVTYLAAGSQRAGDGCTDQGR